MIVDMNAFLGRWPFWKLRYQGVKNLLKLMDRAKIDKAVVSSLDSVFFINYEEGNIDVADACCLHSDRLIPFAVINPNFPLWIDHLEVCVEEYGARGIKLHPDYHKYSLLSEEVAELMRKAKKMKLPVFIQTSIMDMRHHPGYCLVVETSILEVASVIKRYSENTFIIGGAKHFGSRVRELLGQVSECKNFYIETSGIGGPFDCIERLVESIGSSKLLLGTRMPLLYPESAKLMVEKAEIDEEDKEKILGGNASNLLSIQ